MINPNCVSNIRSKAESLLCISEINHAVSQEERKQLKQQYGLNDENNPLLELDVDIYRLV